MSRNLVRCLAGICLLFVGVGLLEAGDVNDMNPLTGKKATLLRLSSWQTFLMKFTLPVLWIGGVGLLLLAMFLVPESFRGGSPPFLGKLAFVVVFIGGVAALWHYVVPLKRVRTDGEALYVSNYLQEVRLPLSDVSDVQECRWMNFRPVAITLRRPTVFGTKIVFVPRGWIPPWRPHPVAEAIRARCPGSLVSVIRE
jgi:hypothetical protein